MVLCYDFMKTTLPFFVILNGKFLSLICQFDQPSFMTGSDFFLKFGSGLGSTLPGSASLARDRLGHASIYESLDDLF